MQDTKYRTLEKPVSWIEVRWRCGEVFPPTLDAIVSSTGGPIRLPVSKLNEAEQAEYDRVMQQMRQLELSIVRRRLGESGYNGLVDSVDRCIAEDAMAELPD
jgi:hypothetical protein